MPPAKNQTVNGRQDDPLAGVKRLLEPVVETVRECAAQVAAALDVAKRGAGSVRTADLDGLLASTAHRLKAAPSLVDGLGFGIAPGVLADADRYLAWWRRDASGDPRLLPLSFEDRPDAYGHYPEAEWFREPVRTGEARLAGPYIDQGATDELTYNYAVPVRLPAADGSVAVASADLIAETLERAAHEALAARNEPAFILSRDDRVIASNTPAFMVGTIVTMSRTVRDVRRPTEFGWTLVNVADVAPRQR